MDKVQKNMIPKRRMTIIAFCLSVIILISTYISSQCLILQVEEKNFVQELEMHTKESLSSAKMLLEDMVDDLQNTANALGKYDDIWNSEAKETLELCHRLNLCDATFMSDTEGNAYADDGSEFSIADQEFFQEALSLQGLLFSKIMQTTSFDAIQIISLPIYSKADPQTVTGYLFGVYDINRFPQVIHTVLDENCYIYIVDTSGTYITTFVEHHKISGTKNFWKFLSTTQMHGGTIEELKKEFEYHTEGDFSYSYGDIRRYGYHIPLGIRDWQIVLSMEESSMDSHAQVLSKIATGVSVINWTCLIIMLWSCYDYFKSRNKEILEANKRIIKNNEIIRIAVESSSRVIFEYNIAEKSAELKTKIPHHLFNSTVISQVPEGFINTNAVADSSIAEFRNLFARIETEASSQADIQLFGEAKDPTWYRIALQNIYGNNGEIISTVGCAEDISLLKQGEAAIKRKEEMHKTLVRNSILYGRIDLSTGMFCEKNGEDVHQSYQEFLEENIPQYVCKEHHSYVMQALSLETLQREYLKGKDYTEVQYKRKVNNEIRWVSALVYRVYESEGTNVTFLIRDIDEQKRTELALKERAEIDGLTGLYNAATSRSKIRDVLSLQHLSEEKQIFILLDLDNFKNINDTFGHAVGDQALMDVSDRLKGHFRSGDIVGRLGGDEFVAMLCDVKSDYYIDTIAGTLSSELVQTYTQDGKSITVSASMGIAVSPDDGVTFEELYKRADTALYQVKKAGKNGYRRWTE